MADRQRDSAAIARLGLYRTYRQSGTQAWLETRGTSMRPLVRAGSRMLVDFGAQPSGVGQVVVFEHGDGIVAHRIVGQRQRDGSEELILKGDAEPFFDRPIAPADVLGIVRGIRPPGSGPVRQRGFDGPSSRLIARVSRWSGRGARVARRVAARTPSPIRGPALRAIPTIARVPTRLIVAPLIHDPGAGRR